MKIIIANTNIQALLKSSDAVLKQYSKGEIPEKIKGQVSLSVLKNLTQRKGWFDVCNVDKLAQMNEVLISAEHQEFFNSLHCVHYEDMAVETWEYLMAILVDYFKGNMVLANANI